MVRPGNSFVIPHFLKAKTPELLQKLMLEQNVHNGKEYNFFDIQFVGGNWYAWYIESVEERLVSKLIQPMIPGIKVKK